MDNFGISDRLCDMDESDFSRDLMPDLNNILQQDMMEMACQEYEMAMSDENSSDKSFDAENLNLDNYDMSPDWLDFFDDPVLNDKMMSEASPVVKSEHSYSIGKSVRGDTLSSAAEAAGLLTVKTEPTTHHITLDEDTGPAINPKFLELDNSKNEPVILNASAVPKNRTIQTVTVTKQEPRVIVKNEPIIIEARRTTQQQSLLKPSASILLTRQNRHLDLTTTTVTTIQPTILPTLNQQRFEMRTSPMSDDMDEGVYLNVMPMTPPGSGSDSDGCSPRQSPTPSPIRQVVFKPNHREINPATAIYSQPIPTSGVLVLTEEEKRTLISEGYPIPTKLPLTKIEEKNLKKVRRKIKNKISAQESRRKRKEYMDHLEKKMEDISRDNTDLRKKCDKYELSNQNLMSQLQKLQNIIRKIAPQQAGQTGICLMVMILCFAVFFGDWLPSQFTSGFGDLSTHDSSLYTFNTLDSYASETLKPSRTLLMMSEEEKSCGNEPWPMFLARKSFECITNLINPSPLAVDESGSWSNNSDMPIYLSSAAHESSLNA